MTDITDVQAIIDAARLSVDPKHIKDIGSVGVYAVRDGIKLVNVNLEHGLAQPMRKHGHITVFDGAAMSRVIADNADAGHVTLYINPDPTTPAIVAVLNSNGPGGPGWGDFRVKIEFRETPQWKKWRAIDGLLKPQADFAEFIEENLADIASPAAAQVMEIVTYLEATRSVGFHAGVKLSSGQVQFQNDENVEAKVGPGKIDVPDSFILGLSPIFGVSPFNVPARFRYRMQEKRLMLGIKLQRIEDIMKTVVADFVSTIDLPENASQIHGVAP